MSAITLRLVAVLVAMSLVVACSARRTANELSHAPQALRLAAHGDVEQPLRWRLPKGARVALAHQGAVPAAWPAAAARGFATVFPAGEDQGFTLQVFWPDHTQRQAPHAVVELAFLGVERLRPQREGRLQVVLTDAAGHAVLVRTLHVRPVLFGAPWHAAANLERAFAHLAQRLAAG